MWWSCLGSPSRKIHTYSSLFSEVRWSYFTLRHWRNLSNSIPVNAIRVNQTWISDNVKTEVDAKIHWYMTDSLSTREDKDSKVLSGSTMIIVGKYMDIISDCGIHQNKINNSGQLIYPPPAPSQKPQKSFFQITDVLQKTTTQFLPYISSLPKYAFELWPRSSCTIWANYLKHAYLRQGMALNIMFSDNIIRINLNRVWFC